MPTPKQQRRRAPNCLRHPSTAAPRRSCWPTGSRPSSWSSWSTPGSRRRASSAWSPGGAGSKSPACGLPGLAGRRSLSFDGPDPQARVCEPHIGRMARIVLRHLMGGHAPTAERTVGPARVIAESLTLKPGIREHNRRQSGRASVRIDDQSHLGNGVCFPLRLLFHCPVAQERQNRCIGAQADHCTGYKQHPSHMAPTPMAPMAPALPKLMWSAIPNRQHVSD